MLGGLRVLDLLVGFKRRRSESGGLACGPLFKWLYLGICAWAQGIWIRRFRSGWVNLGGVFGYLVVRYFGVSGCVVGVGKLLCFRVGSPYRC